MQLKTSASMHKESGAKSHASSASEDQWGLREKGSDLRSTGHIIIRIRQDHSATDAKVAAGRAPWARHCKAAGSETPL